MSKDEQKKRSSKDTEILFQELKESSNIYHFIKANSKELYHPSLSDYLLFLLKKYNLSKSAFIQRSNISRQYAYEIFSGYKNPSRGKIIAMILSIHPTLDEAQRLLTYAHHHPLHPKDLHDTVILHSLQQRMSLIATNDILYTLSLPIIE